VRQEKDCLRRYVHVSTGNYNGKSAKIYTDIGLFTSRPEIGDDIAGLFNEITGLSTPRPRQTISVAPEHLRNTVNAFIGREIQYAVSKKTARIIVKLNALSDPGMIDQLYDASRAGVKIDLIVRGICCLRPGVAGLSENITVRSIVDRYLEHSRIYYFENGGKPEVWLSSADWMTRNLSRRIELMCPIADEKLKQVVIQYLMLLLKDNVKARRLYADGAYRMEVHEAAATRSQFEMQPILHEKYRYSVLVEKLFAHSAMMEEGPMTPFLYH
jgi:polyphosphate kinase